MNWAVLSKGHVDVGLHTAEHLQGRLVALLQRTNALAGLDPYRDVVVEPDLHSEVIECLARAEAERRVEMARDAMGDVRLDGLSDWQLAWLDRLAAQDEWTRHVRDLRALFEMASGQAYPVKMLGD